MYWKQEFAVQLHSRGVLFTVWVLRCDFIKCITLHVSKLNSTCHSLAQYPKWSRSCCNITRSSSLYYYILEPSTNLLIMPSTFYVKTNKNKCQALQQTTCHKSVKHLSTVTQTNLVSNLLSGTSPPCGTLSKALLKFMQSTSTNQLSFILLHLFINLNKLLSSSTQDVFWKLCGITRNIKIEACWFQAVPTILHTFVIEHGTI